MAAGRWRPTGSRWKDFIISGSWRTAKPTCDWTRAERSVEELVDQIVEWLGGTKSACAISFSERHSRQPWRRLERSSQRPRTCCASRSRILVLGDLVGYGADPNAVIDKVRELEPHALIRGNHDKVGSGVESAEGFNAVARNAIRWTYDALTPENRDWLAALPAGADRRRRSDRDLPRHAVRRGRLRLRRPRRAARAARSRARRSACSATPTCRSATCLPGDQFTLTTIEDDASADDALREGSAAPGQPRVGRAAARRRPARRLRALIDTEKPRGHDPPHRIPDRPGRRHGLSPKACRRFSPSDWRSGGSADVSKLAG